MIQRRKRQPESQKAEDRWLITYADMITLLMVFFVVMYSMANTDLMKFAQVAESMQEAFHTLGIGRASGGLIGDAGRLAGGKRAPFLFSQLPPRQRDFVRVTADLTAFASEAGMEGQISVNMNMEGIIISLSNAMLFESGSAELLPESKEALYHIADILKTTDNLVRVEGHTDSIATNNPLYPTNWELSVARAVTIVRFLAEEEDIAPQRLSAAGRAEFKPVAPNDSRDNRALNRRADIVIIYPESSRQFSIDLPQDSNDPGGGSSEDTIGDK